MQNPINLIDPTGMCPDEGGGDPEKKSWFGRAVDTVKGWFTSDKPKGSVTGGEIDWSLVGVISLETEATALVPEGTAAAAATGMSTTSLGVLALPLLFNGDTGREDQKPYFYRNMKADGLFFPEPVLGQSANTLGIRPSDVAGRGFNEIISPFDNQGLSVTFGMGTYKSDSVTPQSIPNFVNGKTTLWRMSPIDLLPLGLVAVPQVSPPGYYRVTPLYDMTIQSFHKRIQLTQKLWEIAPSNRN